MSLAMLAACVLAAGFVIGVVSTLCGSMDAPLSRSASLAALGYDTHDPALRRSLQEVSAVGTAAAVSLVALTLLIGRWWVRRCLPPLAKVRRRQPRLRCPEVPSCVSAECSALCLTCAVRTVNAMRREQWRSSIHLRMAGAAGSGCCGGSLPPLRHRCGQ